MTAKEIVAEVRGWYDERVSRDRSEYFSAFDLAAEMILGGSTREAVLDALSPFGCPSSTSNGVQAGMLTAVRAVREGVAE